MSTIFYVDLDISVRFRSSYSDFGVLCQMFCSYENWCKIMLRRATKMILGVNRIRILQRIQIYTRKFQNAAHWLSKSEKHVHAQSRHQKCPFWSGFWLRESVWLIPFDSSRNSTQKTFFMIFPKILIWHELPWISVNCHEMRVLRQILLIPLDSS